MNERLHLLVTGRVQGVSFRAYTRAEARRRGLVGWVRNLSDGRVEAVAEGPRDALEALLGWVRAGGPPAGRVDSVAVAWGSATAEFAEFGILRP